MGRTERSAAHRCPGGALSKGEARTSRSQNVTSLLGKRAPKLGIWVTRPPLLEKPPTELTGREDEPPARADRWGVKILAGQSHAHPGWSWWDEMWKTRTALFLPRFIPSPLDRCLPTWWASAQTQVWACSGRRWSSGQKKQG